MADKKAGGSTMSKTEYVVDPGQFDIVMTRVFDAARELVCVFRSNPITDSGRIRSPVPGFSITPCREAGVATA